MGKSTETGNGPAFVRGGEEGEIGNDWIIERECSLGDENILELVRGSGCKNYECTK